MATLSTPKTSIGTTTTARFDLGQALEALPEQQQPRRGPREALARQEGTARGFIPTTLAAVGGFGGDDATCPFCMEGLVGDRDDVAVKQAKCGHVFHDVCISTWISDYYSNDSCPLCRCKIV